MLVAALSRLAKGSLVYGVGSVLQRCMSLLLLPLFTRFLTPEDFGVVSLISVLGVLLSGALTLGSANSLGLLYYQERYHNRRASLLWSNTVMLAANCLVWFYLVYMCRGLISRLMFQRDVFASTICLSLLGVMFGVIAEPWLSYLRMEDKAKKFVAITLSSSLTSIVFSIWFVSTLQYGAVGVIAAGVIAQALTLGISLFSLARNMSFHIDLAACYSLIKIGFPSIFGLFAFLLIDYADRQLIERMISLDAVGVYSVGYTLGMAITVGVGAFSAAWPPFFMSYVNKTDEARTVFGRVLSYYVLLFGFIVVAFFAFARPVVLLLTAPNFHAATTVVGLTAAAYMLKGCYLICLPGVYFAHRLYLQSAVEWVAALVNIGLCFALIPQYGLMGAAWATLVSYLTLPVLAWVVSRPYLKVDYEGGRLAKIVVSVVAVSAGIFFYTTSSTSAPSVLLSIGGTILGFFTLLMFSFVLTGSERRAILAWLKR